MKGRVPILNLAQYLARSRVSVNTEQHHSVLNSLGALGSVQLGDCPAHVLKVRFELERRMRLMCGARCPLLWSFPFSLKILAWVASSLPEMLSWGLTLRQTPLQTVLCPRVPQQALHAEHHLDARRLTSPEGGLCQVYPSLLPHPSLLLLRRSSPSPPHQRAFFMDKELGWREYRSLGI